MIHHTNVKNQSWGWLKNYSSRLEPRGSIDGKISSPTSVFKHITAHDSDMERTKMKVAMSIEEMYFKGFPSMTRKCKSVETFQELQEAMNLSLNTFCGCMSSWY